jgi:hypothetical protein
LAAASKPEVTALPKFVSVEAAHVHAAIRSRSVGDG